MTLADSAAEWARCPPMHAHCCSMSPMKKQLMRERAKVPPVDEPGASARNDSSKLPQTCQKVLPHNSQPPSICCRPTLAGKTPPR